MKSTIAERLEDAAVHLGAGIQPEPAFDHELQQQHAVAGVCVAAARIEVQAQALVRLEPVEIREARAMRQQDARRDGAPAIVADEIAPARVGLRIRGRVVGRQGPRQDVRDRAVEPESALVHELHRHVAKHRLGERRAVHHGVGTERVPGGVAHAEGGDPRDATVPDDPDRETAGAGVVHRTADERIELRMRIRPGLRSGTACQEGQRCERDDCAAKDAPGRPRPVARGP